jgi:hypothetical protein
MDRFGSISCGIITRQVGVSNYAPIPLGLLAKYPDSLIANCEWSRMESHFELFDVTFTSRRA